MNRLPGVVSSRSVQIGGGLLIIPAHSRSSTSPRSTSEASLPLVSEFSTVGAFCPVQAVAEIFNFSGFLYFWCIFGYVPPDARWRRGMKLFISGLIAFGVFHIKNTKHHAWQYLFWIEGLFDS